MTTSETITDTDRYPAYGGKADFMVDFEDILHRRSNQKELWRELLYRFSNTDVALWSDGDARHDD